MANKIKEIKMVEVNGVFVPVGEVRIRPKASQVSKQDIPLKIRPQKFKKVKPVRPKYQRQAQTPLSEFMDGFSILDSFLRGL